MVVLQGLAVNVSLAELLQQISWSIALKSKVLHQVTMKVG